MSLLSNLSKRERILVLIVLPLVVLVAGYRFVWQPIEASRAQARADISAFRLVQDTAALARQGGAPVAVAVNDTPLPTRITGSARDAGLTLRRIEPEGQGIRVTLDETPFATVLQWLADLEETHDVAVRAIEVDRRPAPGVVSARLLLDVSR